MEPCRVKEETHNFFKRRFEKSEWERLKLDGVNFRSIGQQHNNFVVARFVENEVVCKCCLWCHGFNEILVLGFSVEV